MKVRTDVITLFFNNVLPTAPVPGAPKTQFNSLMQRSCSESASSWEIDILCNRIFYKSTANS